MTVSLPPAMPQFSARVVRLPLPGSLPVAAPQFAGKPEHHSHHLGWRALPALLLLGGCGLFSSNGGQSPQTSTAPQTGVTREELPQTGHALRNTGNRPARVLEDAPVPTSDHSEPANLTQLQGDGDWGDGRIRAVWKRDRSRQEGWWVDFSFGPIGGGSNEMTPGYLNQYPDNNLFSSHAIGEPTQQQLAPEFIQQVQQELAAQGITGVTPQQIQEIANQDQSQVKIKQPPVIRFIAEVVAHVSAKWTSDLIIGNLLHRPHMAKESDLGNRLTLPPASMLHADSTPGIALDTRPTLRLNLNGVQRPDITDAPCPPSGCYSDQNPSPPRRRAAQQSPVAPESTPRQPGFQTTPHPAPGTSDEKLQLFRQFQQFLNTRPGASQAEPPARTAPPEPAAATENLRRQILTRVLQLRIEAARREMEEKRRQHDDNPAVTGSAP